MFKQYIPLIVLFTELVLLAYAIIQSRRYSKKLNKSESLSEAYTLRIYIHQNWVYIPLTLILFDTYYLATGTTTFGYVVSVLIDIFLITIAYTEFTRLRFIKHYLPKMKFWNDAEKLAFLKMY